MGKVSGVKAHRRDTEPMTYFEWLCQGVREEGGHYDILLSKLHSRRFYWSVPNDDNRAGDGEYLRYEYGDRYPGECTVLEMLVALSNRICFQMGGFVSDNSQSRWFWEMIENLGLIGFTDEAWSVGYRSVYGRKSGQKEGLNAQFHEIITVFLDRNYDAFGTPNCFKFKKRQNGLQNREIWYQMMDYLEENYPI